MFTFKSAMKQASAWLALKEQVNSPKHGRVSARAGVINPLAAREHADSGLSTGALANIQEFGVPGHIPARSFVKAPFQKNQEKYRGMLRGQYAAIAEGLTPEAAMQEVGKEMANDMKAAVKAGIAPSNAAATIKRKESTVPLIETTEMFEAISNDVVKG